jgi:hypothetical protein
MIGIPRNAPKPQQSSPRDDRKQNWDALLQLRAAGDIASSMRAESGLFLEKPLAQRAAGLQIRVRLTGLGEDEDGIEGVGKTRGRVHAEGYQPPGWTGNHCRRFGGRLQA